MIALDYMPEYRLRAVGSSDTELAPPLQAAVQEQLGLTLESRKASVEFLSNRAHRKGTDGKLKLE
jgi:uncharacterized protein (TIGR03435 family)